MKKMTLPSWRYSKQDYCYDIGPLFFSFLSPSPFSRYDDLYNNEAISSRDPRNHLWLHKPLNRLAQATCRDRSLTISFPSHAHSPASCGPLSSSVFYCFLSLSLCSVPLIVYDDDDFISFDSIPISLVLFSLVLFLSILLMHLVLLCCI
jgi:hypothetical protein